MKELTVQEKAKAYNDAIERAKKLMITSTAYDKFTIEKIFPELKEEMNKKIKACIEMCLTDANEQRFKDYNTTLKDCLEWLENQEHISEMHLIVQDDNSKEISKEIIKYIEGTFPNEFSNIEFKNKWITWIENQYQKEIICNKKDEEIRKEIIKYLEQTVPHHHRDEVLKSKEWIAWLENQNTQKHDNAVKPIFNVGDTVRHKNIDGFECTIESIDDSTYYGNTTNFDIKDQNKWELVEPIDSIAYSKDTVWNESDRLHLGSILSILKAERNNAEVEQYRDSVNSDIDWLKSLKNRIDSSQLNIEDLERINRISDFILKNRKGDTDEIYQQEQDVKWLKSLKYLNKCSCTFDEIDKEILKAAVLFIQNNTNEFACNGISKEDVINWLDSLKNSETWQPTEMQLHAFEQVYDWYNNNFALSETLTSLYNDLKKLYENI